MSLLALADDSRRDAVEPVSLAVPDIHEPLRLSERFSLPTPASLLAGPPLIDAKALIKARKDDDVRRLFALDQLEVVWDGEPGVMWAFMRARGRPCYNL